MINSAEVTVHDWHFHSFYFYAIFQIFVSIDNAKQLNNRVVHIFFCLDFALWFVLGVF